MLSKKVKKMSLENRIHILSERGSDCGKLIKKLQRQLRNMEASE